MFEAGYHHRVFSDRNENAFDLGGSIWVNLGGLVAGAGGYYSVYSDVSNHFTIRFWMGYRMELRVR